MSTNRLKLVVAYDGTDFCGWAPQAGLRSVQGTLTEAIRRISGEETEIVGASRTDAGAHAEGQVCHFDSSVEIPEFGWVRALNDVLDRDLAVQRAERAGPAFHARFSARDRRYRYRIATGTRNPVHDRFAWESWREPDLDAMRAAAQGLRGKRDFRAFTAELQPWVQNTIREIRSIEIGRDGREVWIDVVGTAFMRGMMRRIAGGLYEAGLGKRPPEDLEALTSEEGMARLDQPVVLPAKGLTLLEVRYGRRLRDIRDGTDDEDE